MKPAAEAFAALRNRLKPISGQAEHLLSAIEKACLGLAEMPERGNIPKELERLGITEFREFRHMQTVLPQRLPR